MVKKKKVENIIVKNIGKTDIVGIHKKWIGIQILHK